MFYLISSLFWFQDDGKKFCEAAAKKCKAGDDKSCEVYKEKCEGDIDDYCAAVEKKCKAGDKKACDLYKKKCGKVQ